MNQKFFAVCVGLFLVAGLKSVGSVSQQFPSEPMSQAAQTVQQLQSKCLEAGDRVEHDAAAMAPGRPWTWGLNADDSRKRLGQLQKDLEDFWHAEEAFEQSIPMESAQRGQSQFQAIHELFQHLHADGQSLEEELEKGTPTRWHVAKDVSDMQKEIQRWRKLHNELAAELGLMQLR